MLVSARATTTLAPPRPLAPARVFTPGRALAPRRPPPRPVCLATPRRTAPTKGAVPPAFKWGKASNSKPPNNNNDDDGRGLALFRWSLYTRPWDIAWGGKETAGIMLAWLLSFLLTGLSVGPLFIKSLGAASPADLTAADKSTYLLVNQVVETLVGLAIVYGGVSKFKPLPDDLLKTSSSNPFALRDGWLTWAVLGILASPAVIGAAASLTAALAGGATPTGRGTADAVAGLLDVDPATVASLFIVTAILAPILEETVFRGFLLPSLTKWMPVPAAVVVSAVAFAAAHLSAKDFPQLLAFGLLLGFSYARTRNLLTTMVMHGAWNGSVLLLLAALSASGADLKQLLAGG